MSRGDLYDKSRDPREYSCLLAKSWFIDHLPELSVSARGRVMLSGGKLGEWGLGKGRTLRSESYFISKVVVRGSAIRGKPNEELLESTVERLERSTDGGLE